VRLFGTAGEMLESAKPETPDASPTVVARILITQKKSVTSGTLFNIWRAVGICRPSSDGAMPPSATVVMAPSWHRAPERDLTASGKRRQLRLSEQARMVMGNLALLAEGVGFEPTSRLTTANGFRDRPVQPLRHPSGASAKRNPSDGTSS
jgi:hypothetical protein